jgi:hypothetical protein
MFAVSTHLDLAELATLAARLGLLVAPPGRHDDEQWLWDRTRTTCAHVAARAVKAERRRKRKKKMIEG